MREQMELIPSSAGLPALPEPKIDRKEILPRYYNVWTTNVGEREAMESQTAELS